MKFFKRSNKSKLADQPSVAADGALAAGCKGNPLHTADLRRITDPAMLGFASTADIEPTKALAAQSRALKAISFGASMAGNDYNVFLVLPSGSEGMSAVRDGLHAKAASGPAPYDWVYVNNFANPREPVAISLPPGRAREFAMSMRAAIEELKSTVPAAFKSEDFKVRRRAIDEDARAEQDGAVETFGAKAAAQNIALLRTPMGYTMAPMHDGKAVKPEIYNQLPEAMRQEVEVRMRALQTELCEILSAAPDAARRCHARMSDLSADVARRAVDVALGDVRRAFLDVQDVLTYLDAARADLVQNAGLFVSGKSDGQIAVAMAGMTEYSRFRRYMVNVLVSHGAGSAGPPVVEMSDPSAQSLTGFVGRSDLASPSAADFLQIVPGALHRANGGYLLADARALLSAPGAWEALKRTLQAAEIRVSPRFDVSGPNSMLEPNAIPLTVKAVLFGGQEDVARLLKLDPGFSCLFKIQTDLDISAVRNAENERAYAGLVAAVVAEHGLKPVTASGVARLIEESARLAGDSEKLSLDTGRSTGLLREADACAAAAERTEIGAGDVARAVAARSERALRKQGSALEGIDLQGSRTGEVNALAAVSQGAVETGRPVRVTARARLGHGRIEDITFIPASDTAQLHSRAAVLWGFLAGLYASDLPLALSAAVEFESECASTATAAGLLALLSALAEAPVSQNIAVAGGTNVRGELLAVAQINGLIEDYFDACTERGLGNRHGVIIPAANAKCLMLRDDVVDAARAGTFDVYAVANIDEAIGIVTGVPAGFRGDKGVFPDGSIHRRVEDRLVKMAARSREFGIGMERSAQTQKVSA